MTPHLSEEETRSYRDRSLAAPELLSVSNHIAECEACRASIASSRDLSVGVEAFRAVLDAEAAAAAHLTYHEIAAYVDGQLTGEEGASVEMHSRECELCAADVAQIEALRSEIALSQRSPNWFRRIANFWQETVGWKGSLILAGAAACASLALLVVPRPVRRNLGQQANVRPPQTTGAAEIHDGKRTIAVGAGGTVSGLDGLPDSCRASLERALTGKQIEVSAALADLAGRRSVLLGSSTEASRVDLLGPLSVVIETQRPLFRWTPLAGAEYRVSVYGDGYNEVANSGWIRSAEWQLPRALPRGSRYSWQLNMRHNGVELTIPAPPAPEARFRVLAEAEAAEIARLKAGWGDSHLVLGVRYAQAGMLDEAAAELRHVREENPRSPTVGALLDSVERLRSPKP